MVEVGARRVKMTDCCRNLFNKLIYLRFIIVVYPSGNELKTNLDPGGIVEAMQEDRTIEELVKKYGHKSWANLSLHISKLYNIPRTGKQCRER